MIIDYSQKRDGIELSYVNDNGQIEIETVKLDSGYYAYVECLDSDEERIPNLKSFTGKSIKKEPAKYFFHHNINEFLTYDLKNNYPSIYEKVSKLNIPLLYSVDIETEITDEFGYSNQEKAENRILSITITDINMNSIMFVVKNPEHPVITPTDKGYIYGVIQEALGEHKSKYEYNFEVRTFETETEMLDLFLVDINKYFHVIIGWNFLGYDMIYIANRCEKLGLDLGKASPTFKTITHKLETRKHAKEEEKVDVKLPLHRVIADYMMMFKKSLTYNNLESYSLNAISDKILGLSKVIYDGNLRKLYEEDYLRFIGYAFIDTILVMLIHKAVNLYNVDFFQSYYTNVPYLKISQNAISEALVYNELREQNVFLLSTEKTQPVKREYQGGFVKDPVKKISLGVFGIDFSSLYPNSINTIGISPERKVQSINVNEEGWPLTKDDEDIWNAWKAQGYTLSPMGRIYDSRTDGLYPRIEKKLLAQRNEFRNYEDDIFLNIIETLEKRKKEILDNQK